ncbi:hypothetical protein [Streptomyces sp. MA15]|uniref:hypothetical protein n=1 Tax=Streptomyces sp. MA15 TaxID=3055061 RepID=UPI0025B1B8EA|nr:hypothetical protein [Streptomyces sp. MA15]MDN3271224.1 hypothetical protein [Streptomyces sp. MA15]
MAYNASFDRAVLEREPVRHHAAPGPVRAWLGRCRWEDAMAPVAVWEGLWTARYAAYRYRPLGGGYDAVANCRVLLRLLGRLAGTVAVA